MSSIKSNSLPGIVTMEHNEDDNTTSQHYLGLFEFSRILPKSIATQNQPSNLVSLNKCTFGRTFDSYF